MRRTCFSLLSALMFVFWVTVPASAQAMGASDEEIDSRWSPWLGCWQLTLETYDYDDERPEGEVVVCLAPRANDMGVGVTTWADGAVVLTKTLVADGTEYAVDESGCKGWRSAEWSQDGRRLFISSELTCEGASARTISGVSMFLSGETWIDIQLISSGERKELVMRRYRNADMSSTEDWEKTPQAAPVSPTARSAAARKLTIENIIEASRKVDAEVLEAMLVESQTTIHVDSQSLVLLADSNVPVGIIDLMVALSYPEQFEIRSREAVGGGGGLSYDDFLYGGGYDPYGYWYPFYFAPFGYYSYAQWYGGYGGYYLLTPSEKPADAGGKVVKGHGYTRVWPKDRSGRASGGSGWFKGDSSSGGQASSSGYSRGSGSGSTGRTAKPKNKN
jgi:uncharacterized membrane protein YgcG